VDQLLHMSESNPGVSNKQPAGLVWSARAFCVAHDAS